MGQGDVENEGARKKKRPPSRLTRLIPLAEVLLGESLSPRFVMLPYRLTSEGAHLHVYLPVMITAKRLQVVVVIHELLHLFFGLRTLNRDDVVHTLCRYISAVLQAQLTQRVSASFQVRQCLPLLP